MADTNAEPQDAQATSAAATPSQDKGTFLPLIFGGAFATALGFFGGQLDSVEQALGWAEDDSALQQVIEAQAEQLEAQSAKIEELSTQLANLPEPELPEVDLSGVESLIADQSGLLAALTERVVEVEKRPLAETVSEGAIEAYEAELARLQSIVEQQSADAESKMADIVANYEAELAALQGSVESQRGEVASLLDDARTAEQQAEEKAQKALARVAMTQIITSVESGEPFADALAELDAAGGTEVPEGLRAVADEGTPTLAELQAAFPAAARAALSVARSEEAAEGAGGLGGFLQRQLGARSVTPQEGDGADAVLSRAEAAAREGRLGDALAEVKALPDSAKAPLMDWIKLAETRFAATSAADELMTALSAN